MTQMTGGEGVILFASLRQNTHENRYVTGPLDLSIWEYIDTLQEVLLQSVPENNS